METPDTSGAIRKPLAFSVDSVPPTNGAATSPPLIPAGNTVADFGGNATGRKSEFHFPVNTPQGQQERREADAKRKQLRRQTSARLAEPPPLPSAIAGSPGEQSPAPDAGVAGSPGSPGPMVVEAPAVPWTPELVKEFTDEIIAATEEHRQTSISGLAKEGGLSDKIVKKIYDDSKYPAGSKRGLLMATPKVVARVMNKTGISSEHADTMVLLGSMLMIWRQGASLKKDVLEMIEASNKAKSTVTRPAPELVIDEREFMKA